MSDMLLHGMILSFVNLIDLKLNRIYFQLYNFDYHLHNFSLEELILKIKLLYLN